MTNLRKGRTKRGDLDRLPEAVVGGNSGPPNLGMTVANKHDASEAHGEFPSSRSCS